MKAFMNFINTLYWLWLFIVPLLPIGLVSVWLYDRSPENIPYIAILGVIGIISGIALAESVRKRRGLSTFFGTILSTPDIEDKSISGQSEKQDDSKSNL